MLIGQGPPSPSTPIQDVSRTPEWKAYQAQLLEPSSFELRWSRGTLVKGPNAPRNAAFAFVSSKEGELRLYRDGAFIYHEMVAPGVFLDVHNMVFRRDRTPPVIFDDRFLSNCILPPPPLPREVRAELSSEKGTLPNGTPSMTYRRAWQRTGAYGFQSWVFNLKTEMLDRYVEEATTLNGRAVVEYRITSFMKDPKLGPPMSRDRTRVTLPGLGGLTGR